MRQCFNSGMGRGQSLGPSRRIETSDRHASAARCWLDHPRLDRRSFLQNALFLAERAYRIPRCFQGLEAVMRHKARLKRYIMERVALALGPLLKEVDRVDHAGDLLYHVFPTLQVNRPVKDFRVHRNLLDFLLIQRSHRLRRAAEFYMFSGKRCFKTIVSDLARQYPRFLGSFYERLPGSLRIAFSFKALEQSKPCNQVLLTLRRTYRPVMQEHVSGLHCIGDEVPHPAVLAGVNGHTRLPAVVRHDAAEPQGRGLVPC